MVRGFEGIISSEDYGLITFESIRVTDSYNETFFPSVNPNIKLYKILLSVISGFFHSYCSGL